eukprot:36987_1
MFHNILITAALIALSLSTDSDNNEIVLQSITPVLLPRNLLFSNTEDSHDYTSSQDNDERGGRGRGRGRRQNGRGRGSGSHGRHGYGNRGYQNDGGYGRWGNDNGDDFGRWDNRNDNDLDRSSSWDTTTTDAPVPTISTTPQILNDISDSNGCLSSHSGLVTQICGHFLGEFIGKFCPI